VNTALKATGNICLSVEENQEVMKSVSTGKTVPNVNYMFSEEWRASSATGMLRAQQLNYEKSDNCMSGDHLTVNSYSAAV